MADRQIACYWYLFCIALVLACVAVIIYALTR